MTADRDLIASADWTSPEGRALLARLEAAASPRPWVPDIDQIPPPYRGDNGATEEWTGKFYVGTDEDPSPGTWTMYADEGLALPNVRLVQAMRSAVGPMMRRISELEAQAVDVAAERARCLGVVEAMREGWGDQQRREHAQHVCNSIAARIKDPTWKLR